MKCLVPVKRVIDFGAKIRVKADKSRVETANVKMSMNPFDEIALEEAVKLKEQAKVSEVIAVSVGAAACQETLREALARGADRAILVTSMDNLLPLNIAKILQKIVIKEQINLVIMGKQAIDSDCNQTGQMLAGLLGWGQGTFASNIELSANKAVVTREIDAGLETIELVLPAVITVDLRLNEPRYISLPNVMRAKSKPLAEITLDDLAIKTTNNLQLIQVEIPPKRSAGKLVKSASELVSYLTQEGVI